MAAPVQYHPADLGPNWDTISWMSGSGRSVATVCPEPTFAGTNLLDLVIRGRVRLVERFMQRRQNPFSISLMDGRRRGMSSFGGARGFSRHCFSRYRRAH